MIFLLRKGNFPSAFFYLEDNMSVDLQTNYPQQILGDDPQKDEAQKMATDLQTLLNLFKALQQNPTDADAQGFWALICSAVNSINIEYQYLSNGAGPIPQNEVTKMFGGFNEDVLGYRIAPGTHKTFQFTCVEAESKNYTDLHTFLDSLKNQPGVFEILIQETQKAQQMFKEYADSH